MTEKLFSDSGDDGTENFWGESPYRVQFAVGGVTCQSSGLDTREEAVVFQTQLEYHLDGVDDVEIIDVDSASDVDPFDGPHSLRVRFQLNGVDCYTEGVSDVDEGVAVKEAVRGVESVSNTDLVRVMGNVHAIVSGRGGGLDGSVDGAADEEDSDATGMVNIPFDTQFLEPIGRGDKTATLRVGRYDVESGDEVILANRDLSVEWAIAEVLYTFTCPAGDAPEILRTLGARHSTLKEGTTVPEVLRPHYETPVTEGTVVQGIVWEVQMSFVSDC